MSASFTAASSQRLVGSWSAASIGGTNNSFAFWFMPFAININQTIVALALSTNTTDYLEVRLTSTNALVFSAASGGTETNINISGACTANQWHYCIAQSGNSNNRKLDLWKPGGSVVTGSSTSSKSVGACDTLSIGSRESSTPTQFFGGLIAEFYYQRNTGAANASNFGSALTRMLAHNSPLKYQFMRDKSNFTLDYLFEYRSFRSSLAPDVSGFNEFQMGPQMAGAGGSASVTSWTNTNGVTIGAHPPLPYSYFKPGQRMAFLAI